MLPFVIFAIDLFAVPLLVFAPHFRRQRRRELVAAYLGVNAGAVAFYFCASALGILGPLGGSSIQPGVHR